MTPIGTGDAGRHDVGWDDVVVGAGSCGSVLAGRLAQASDRRVLLVEAGPDGFAASGAAASLQAPVLEGYNWDYEAYVDGEAGEASDARAVTARRCPYRVGRVVGGSSAVNGAIALRGLPADFDGWAAAGNPDWAWERVRPWFRRIEADADFAGTGHGSSGPVPIRRTAAARLDPVARAFRDACRALGLPDLADLNDGAGVGVGPVPANTLDGRRMSTAHTHLDPVRHRPNLTVWADTEVRRLVLHRGRTVGLELLRDGRPLRVRATRTALCAGAVNTPALLLRSGIGPAGRLERGGVRCLADLPGVGENLADHPTLAVWSVQRPGGGEPSRSEHSTMARLALGPGAAAPDTTLVLANNVAIPDMPGIGPILGKRLCVSVAATLLDPVSRGRVELRPGDPAGPPVIRLGLARHPDDVERLMRGVRFAWALTRTPPLADLLERTLLWTERLVGDDALLRAAVPRFVSPMWHPAGTARMGPPGDPLAVVDQHCRVHGVPGLWVVDASVLPTVPRATPNLTCIVLAERAAGWLGAAPVAA